MVLTFSRHIHLLFTIMSDSKNVYPKVYVIIHMLTHSHTILHNSQLPSVSPKPINTNTNIHTKQFCLYLITQLLYYIQTTTIHTDSTLGSLKTTSPTTWHTHLQIHLSLCRRFKIFCNALVSDFLCIPTQSNG